MAPFPYAPRLITALAVAALPAFGATVIYVDGSAPPGGDGASWAGAHRFLQDALTAADAAVPPVEIRVAQGVYKPDQDRTVPLGSKIRDAAFALRSGVTIKGGFAGLAAGANADVRNTTQFPTRLSGDLDGDDGPAFAGSSENTYQIVVAVNVDETAVLDGFIVSGARADGPGFGPVPASREQGGAVNVYDAQPRLVNCIFERNWMANHGTVNDHGDATLVNCEFRDNFSASFGAGLYIHNHSRTHAVNCRFFRNVATTDGGGAYSRSSIHDDGDPHDGHGGMAVRSGGGTRQEAAHFTNCVFRDNVAVRGAGAYNTSEAQTKFEGCEFTNNDAIGLGGGIYCDASTTPIIEACEFFQNDAPTGGGVYAKDAMPEIHGCFFFDNTALDGEGGGGVWLEESPTTVEDCWFEANEGFNGAGLYNKGSVCPTVINCDFVDNHSLNDNGGGISNVFCGATAINCRFVNNTTNFDSEDPFVVGGGFSSYLGASKLIGCYFSGNTAVLGGGGYYQEGGDGPSYVINCVFENNSAGSGGGMYSLLADIFVSNTVFAGNAAVGTDFSAFAKGGALHNSFDCDISLSNCTIVNNTALTGGGLSNNLSRIELRNSIVWGNSNDEIFSDDPATVAVSHCLIAGGWPGAIGPVIDVDPRFADAAGGDFSLAADSPAIDLADPAYTPADEEAQLDAAGNPRRANCLIDLGAYEFQSIETLRGDVNLDAQIDANDINLFVEAILGGGNPAQRCRADVNQDGAPTVGDIGPFVDLITRR